MSNASIVSVNISSTRGVRKTPIPQGELRPDHGLVGDAHAGDWHRQLSVLALESIESARRAGHDVNPGDCAENITTQGLTLHTLPVGSRLRLGAAEVEITQIGKKHHPDGSPIEMVGNRALPREGVFVRVLEPGVVKQGDKVELISQPGESLA